MSGGGEEGGGKKPEKLQCAWKEKALNKDASSKNLGGDRNYKHEPIVSIVVWRENLDLGEAEMGETAHEDDR